MGFATYEAQSVHCTLAVFWNPMSVRDTYVPFPHDGIPHVVLPEVGTDGRVIVIGGANIEDYLLTI